MDELDRATRRIAGIDADDALREYTERVGDVESRFGLDDDEDEDEDEPEPDDSGSVSLLGLEVDEYEDAANRLATIDGVEDTENPATKPAGSGAFFGSFSDDPAEEDDESEDDLDIRYFVIRDKKDYGPYAVSSLGEMIRTGRVRSVDMLRAQLTGQECMAVDVPALRPACEERRAQEDKDRLEAPRRTGETPAVAEPAEAGRPASPTPREGRRPLWLTTAIVAALVAVLGVAGWILLRGGSP
jgi:hypothetical protein